MLGYLIWSLAFIFSSHFLVWPNLLKEWCAIRWKYNQNVVAFLSAIIENGFQESEFSVFSVVDLGTRIIFIDPNTYRLVCTSESQAGGPNGPNFYYVQIIKFLIALALSCFQTTFAFYPELFFLGVNFPHSDLVIYAEL